MKLREDKTLIITSKDVQEIIKYVGVDALMDTLLWNLRASVKSFDSRLKIPVRSGFHYEKPNSGLVEWMPIYEEGENVLLKVVGYHPLNSQRYSLPTIVSTISAYNTNTGHLSAIMDGGLLTALRTGAASALVSEVLAIPESSTLGLIGCGAQAVTQLHAISRKFKLKRVLINDVDDGVVSSFEYRCDVLGLKLDFEVLDVNDIVENSDILCTATSVEIGEGPLFSKVSTKPHLHINAVGSDFPGKIEIPSEFLKSSFVCPDFLEQAVIEGECQQLENDEIGEDFVEIVQNSDKYISVQNRRSVFDSTGWALEDKVAMDLFLDFALELGLGHEIEIENISKDAKNPYDFVNAEKVELENVGSKIGKALSGFTT